MKTQTETAKETRQVFLETRWTVSRGRDTYGYNICTLFAAGEKVAACNGGGYDMTGTVLGSYIARAFKDRLLLLTEADAPENSHWERDETPCGKIVSGGRYFYGLSFIDPDYDPGKAVLKRAPVFGSEADAGKTVEQAEKEGSSLGLERYQAFWGATAKFRTEKHVIPHIDGACGRSSVETIANAVGLRFQWLPGRRNASAEKWMLHIEPWRGCA